MKAAIYARKSNNDDRTGDNKSVTRQVEHAKAYAKKHCWTVDDAHVFIDDGISGAEFKNRPGLVRMLAQLEEFDCVVCSELSRLGRDMGRNAVLIDDIRTAGVRIFYYLTDEEEHADTPEQRMIVGFKSYASEVERAKTGQRTRDTLSRKAAKGFSTGGSCYGYNLVPVIDPSTGERTHTDMAINEQEAAVVRSIFAMYCDGYGYDLIGKTLNGDDRYKAELKKYFGGVIHKAPRNGLGVWGGTGIRAMLYRPRYIGIVEYGKTKKVRSGGSAKKRGKGDNVITIERPDLRIVPDELWQRTQKRLASMKAVYTNQQNKGTRPDTGRESKYLLSGIARCECCGGNITSIGGDRGNYYYGCSVYQNKGKTVCTNDHREAIPRLDAAVLSAITENGLTPDAFDYVIESACRMVEEEKKGSNPVKRQKELEAETRKVQRELERFLNLIAEGNAPQTVLAEILRREDRLKVLSDEMRTLQIKLPDELALKRLRRRAVERLKQLRDVIQGSDVREVRPLLRMILGDTHLHLSPVTRDKRKTLDFKGEISLGEVLYKLGAEERT